MITIIAGTNRPDSMTLRIAEIYHRMVSAYTDGDVKLLSLLDVQAWSRAGVAEIEKDYLIPAEKYIFIMPEYNASFPGVLKMMIDNSDIKKCWWHKKAALVGISDGRAGNLRGIEHMTAILHYMKVNVHFNKLVLSRINEEVSKSGEILKPATEAAIRQQIEEFIKY